MNNYKKLKIIVVSLGLGVIMLTATSVQAQMIDLLDEYYEELEREELEQRNNQSILNRSGSSSGGYNISQGQFGSDDYGGFNIGTQLFGQEAPLGGGCLVLAFAGVAYSFKKRKNNNKK